MHKRRVKRIAIIGAGDMGSRVAAELHHNGFEVTTGLDEITEICHRTLLDYLGRV